MRGRLTRWIGLALMAVAAMTMIAGDVFAAEPEGPAPAPYTSFTLRFDLLSPGGVTCDADAPGAVVRPDRDLTGKQMLHLTGDLAGARVTCTAPDGSRWQTALPADSRDRLATAVDGRIIWRTGAKRVPLLVRADRDHYTDYERHSFTRLP